MRAIRPFFYFSQHHTLTLRRLVATLLLFTLCVQSSAAATFGPSVGISTPFLAQLRFDFALAIARSHETYIGALLTGNVDRYNLMHGPAPKRPDVIKSDPTTVMHRGLIHPTRTGEGTRGTAPTMLNRPLLPKDAEKLHPPIITPSGINVSSGMRAPAIIVSRPRVIRRPSPHVSARGIHPMDVNVGSTNATGTNPWWSYQEGGIPGVGKYMVNVANGNLIVQATDVDVPERGIDLAFRRTYNSQSLRDWNANGLSDDGSLSPGTYGTGWTNTFDAHIAPNTAGGITVFDIDGARYDYTPNGTGCLTPPAGMHNTLCTDGGPNWLWTTKNGTVYYFFNATSGNAYAGRLYRIYGRNQNNYIQFNYYWVNGDASTTNNLTQIVAQHSDGQSLTLAFGSVNGHQLLSSITRPDGQQVSYLYPNPAGNNNYGNLEEVDRPGNNQGTLKEQYGYYSSNGYMNWVASPLWFMTGQEQGAYTWFNYSGANISGVQLFGYSNFVPNDGTGAPLQSGSTSYQQIGYSSFSYSGGETQFSDVDGHATNWFFDSSGRVTQLQQWTGSVWLVSGASWDANNNLTETVDPRGYATDVAYDSRGNTIALALPQVSTSQGTFRPTILYSYDGNNNVIAYCDQSETHSLGLDWTTNPGSSDTLCPSQGGASRYTWATSASTPFGYLTDSYSPLGYHRAFQYNTAAQNGDFGLVSDFISDCMGQIDGNSRCPHSTFTYSGNGQVATYGTGNGTWNLSYDALNRLVASTDPDGVTSRVCYFANSQISATQTALQYQLDGGSTCGSHSVSYGYDADGNQISEVHHYGNVAGTTNLWYDGADRLVEVQKPSDPQDVFQNAWATRYLYDLTQGGTVSMGSANVQYYTAHGNLYKSQELLLSGASQSVAWYSGQARLNNTTFQDLKGTAFDALDRVTKKYPFGDGPNSETFTYDSSSNSYGQLAQHCNALGACGSVTYDAAARPSQISYSDGTTPSESTTYDADGRATAINSSTFGTQNYTFDADGRQIQSSEPSGGGVTAPATLTYHYYGDGTRSAIDVSSSALNQSSLLAYSYRADGKLEQEKINLASDPLVGSSAIALTYSNGGRMTQRSESGPAANGLATTSSYDINNSSDTGTLTSLNYPAASISGLSYDAEGELLGYQRSIANVGSGSATFSYTTRGEETLDSRTSSQAINFANGIAVSSTSQNIQSWDARTGEVFGDNVDQGTTGSSFSYDGAGRQTSRTDVTFDRYGNEHDYQSTRQYDAENRIVSGSQQTHGVGILGTYNTLTAYQWGPNGLPILVGSTPRVSNGTPSTSLIAYDTLHWDGNQVLFTTNSQGQLDDIKLGANGDITPLDPSFTGLTFWDRLAGSVAFCHNETGAAGNDAGSASHTTSGCTVLNGQTIQQPSTLRWGSSGLAAGIGQGNLMGMPGVDGLADGTGIIQGGRMYDSQLGGWTVPDAYPGKVGDPSSQKSYVWNGNNPTQNTDASGFSVAPTPGSAPPVWIPPNVLPPVPAGTTTCWCTPGSAADQSFNADLKPTLVWTTGTGAIFYGPLGGLVGIALGYGGMVVVEYFGTGHRAPADTLYIQQWYNGHGGITRWEEYVPGPVARAHGARPFDALISTNWTGSETVIVVDGSGRHEYHYGPDHTSKGYVSDMQADAMNGAYSTDVSGTYSTSGTTIVGGYNDVHPI